VEPPSNREELLPLILHHRAALEHTKDRMAHIGAGAGPISGNTCWHYAEDREQRVKPAQ
jgi:hypothetical protein